MRRRGLVLTAKPLELPSAAPNAVFWNWSGFAENTPPLRLPFLFCGLCVNPNWRNL